MDAFLPGPPLVVRTCHGHWTALNKTWDPNLWIFSSWYHCYGHLPPLYSITLPPLLQNHNQLDDVQ